MVYAEALSPNAATWPRKRCRPAHPSAQSSKHHSASTSDGEYSGVTHQMIDHRHEQIEEQRRPAPLHLHLHGAAALEGAAAADDEGEVVRAQLAVGGWRVGVGEARGRQDGAALHAGLEALFFERQALEVGEVVPVGGALEVEGVSGVGK